MFDPRTLRMGNTWYTSDLHLGHANIITYSARPFRSVKEMNDALIERWNDVVSADDTVWVLGDVALGKIAKTLPLVSLLKGTKRLVPGNHDRCWPGHRKGVEAWRRRYEDVGLIVHSEIVRRGEWLLSHLPYEGDSHDDDRFERRRPVDDGRVLLHGHVHERWRVNGRMINVGVDVWDFTPVSEARVAQLVEASARETE